MSETSVLIPFKAQGPKSRLASVLDQGKRRRLAELMLLDMLAVLRETKSISQTFVISSDVRARELSEESGARTVHEEKDSGVNAAVMGGLRAIGGTGDALVLPADLPLISAREIEAALSLKRAVDCVLTPSRSFNGTNLLTFSARSPPKLSYDSDSFWSHLEGAARTGLRLAVLCSPGLMADVDVVEDLSALSQARRRSLSAEFARQVLRERR